MPHATGQIPRTKLEQNKAQTVDTLCRVGSRVLRSRVVSTCRINSTALAQHAPHRSVQFLRSRVRQDEWKFVAGHVRCATSRDARRNLQLWNFREFREVFEKKLKRFLKFSVKLTTYTMSESQLIDWLKSEIIFNRVQMQQVRNTYLNQ